MEFKAHYQIDSEQLTCRINRNIMEFKAFNRHSLSFSRSYELIET